MPLSIARMPSRPLTARRPHGLVRFTRRYKICGRPSTAAAPVRMPARCSTVSPAGIPIYASLDEGPDRQQRARLPIWSSAWRRTAAAWMRNARKAVMQALEKGLGTWTVGLHEFLSEDRQTACTGPGPGCCPSGISGSRRNAAGCTFSAGRIDQVKALRVAILGTDSAVGKRTTAWLLGPGASKKGGINWPNWSVTGQTAWLQGARFRCSLWTPLVNDFVSGEIENAICNAWEQAGTAGHRAGRPGQLAESGPIPVGFELLAAGRPDLVVLQHAPARKEYDGFPGFLIQPLAHQISAIELISGRPVVAVTVNHEALSVDRGALDLRGHCIRHRSAGSGCAAGGRRPARGLDCRSFEDPVIGCHDNPSC